MTDFVEQMNKQIEEADSVEDFRSVGQELYAVMVEIKWLLGKWMALREKKLGYGTIARCAREVRMIYSQALRLVVAFRGYYDLHKKFPRLTHSFFTVVNESGLEDEDKEELLAMAEDGEWKIIELKGEIQRVKDGKVGNRHGENSTKET